MKSNSCRYFLKRVSVWCVMVTLNVSAFSQSAYISRVYEYKPAPGQFINESPEYRVGDTEQDMLSKVENLLCGAESGTISLGGWGGYIVFGFDHRIVNIEGEYDFRILGNAFYADAESPINGGSSEPGVVYVSRDNNGNGLPDDEWYELAGSEYERSIQGYQLTYFRTPEDHVRTPKPTENLIDTTYILWRDIDGNRGYICQTRYHLQNYWPEWITDDRLVFTGTLLPSNAVMYKEDGITKYILNNYEYGYADNHPNDTEGSKMKIDWAVNSKGETVSLDGIDFVKVMTGVNQQCGWIGESSTEISGAVDLHIKDNNTAINGTMQTNNSNSRKMLYNGTILLIHNGSIYNIYGQVAESPANHPLITR